MEFTAKQIAQVINGRIEGNENATINSFAKIEEGKQGAISFISNPKHCSFRRICSLRQANINHFD